MTHDASAPASPSPEDVAHWLNATLDGWSAAMSLRFLRASADEVTATWEVGPSHRQPYGIVHGGVHSGVIETVASVGAALHAMAHGQTVVGLDNHTSFLRAVREGTLTARAVPVTRGRRSQLWDGTVTDASGRTVATGRVRLLSLDPDATLAGEAVAVRVPGHAR